MSDYIIDGELRDNLIGLLVLLQKHSEKDYQKFSDSYTNRLLLANGKELKLPYLSDLQTDLENLDEVIETGEYDSRAEEFIGFIKGNVIKYIVRCGKKGNPIDDI